MEENSEKEKVEEKNKIKDEENVKNYLINILNLILEKLFI